METNHSKEAESGGVGGSGGGGGGEILDCGNLDLLASVTQNFDQVVDCETSVASCEKWSSFSPPSSLRPVETYGPPDLSSTEPVVTSKEQHTAKRKGGGGGGAGGRVRKRKSNSSSNSVQKQVTGSSAVSSGSGTGPGSSVVATVSSNRLVRYIAGFPFFFPLSLLSPCSTVSQCGPPLSLQELLERQWEQTAQFILDQAGRQNNGK